MRISDQEFIDAQTQCLSGFEPSSGAETGDSPGVSLKPGRPRMSASLVFMFLARRGFLGNLNSASSRRMLDESISLKIMVENAGIDSMPAPNTITSRLNNLPHSRRKMKRLYKKLFDKARKTSARLESEFC